MKKILNLVAVAGIAGIMLMIGACGQTGKESTGESSQASGTKVLKVAMECSYAPYNWSQPDNSNGAIKISNGQNEYAYGYDVMMAKHIGKELGYEIEITRLDWDALVPAVQSGQVDCVIAGQSITSERLKSVDFTSPYYYASVVTLVKKDGKFADAKSLADLKGASVTAQQNTIWYDICAKQIPDANILTAQDSSPAALVALDSGKCDAVITDMPTAKAALVAHPDFKLLDFEGDAENDYKVSEEEVNIGISLKKGNTELKDSINSVLDKMDKTEFEKMMDEAIKVQPLGV
ncbi:transporter substrate-binding domain-containing protein [Johnsonella ignava]|nr:transporter substrate-binding domain-containing protein [Johnsonella ignava]